MIVNITQENFGGALRSGDLIAAMNMFEDYRNNNTDNEITFYMTPGSVSSESSCQVMLKFLQQNTDYFSLTPGTYTLPWKRVNLWDFRDICGDLVHIENPYLSAMH